jgi:hypothetical protein
MMRLRRLITDSSSTPALSAIHIAERDKILIKLALMTNDVHEQVAPALTKPDVIDNSNQLLTKYLKFQRAQISLKVYGDPIRQRLFLIDCIGNLLMTQLSADLRNILEDIKEELKFRTHNHIQILEALELNLQAILKKNGKKKKEKMTLHNRHHNPQKKE